MSVVLLKKAMRTHSINWGTCIIGGKDLLLTMQRQLIGLARRLRKDMLVRKQI